ncbi:hypothetical protein LJC34_00550 [Oscillospiraceae bacterium OttesenSCG-928-G22]|nr:hypothetical protein [Oscillospiraceae bacterium OttesenSCG-928-G22]
MAKKRRNSFATRETSPEPEMRIRRGPLHSDLNSCQGVRTVERKVDDILSAVYEENSGLSALRAELDEILRRIAAASAALDAETAARSDDALFPLFSTGPVALPEGARICPGALNRNAEAVLVSIEAYSLDTQPKTILHIGGQEVRATLSLPGHSYGTIPFDVRFPAGVYEIRIGGAAVFPTVRIDFPDGSARVIEAGGFLRGR